MAAQNPAHCGQTLSTQALARPLVPAEAALATALETIFAAGIHAFPEVARELQVRGIVHPSGAKEPWTEAGLLRELAAINASLDASYARDGIGA